MQSGSLAKRHVFSIPKNFKTFTESIQSFRGHEARTTMVWGRSLNLVHCPSLRFRFELEKVIPVSNFSGLSAPDRLKGLKMSGRPSFGGVFCKRRKAFLHRWGAVEGFRYVWSRVTPRVPRVQGCSNLLRFDLLERDSGSECGGWYNFHSGSIH